MNSNLKIKKTADYSAVFIFLKKVNSPKIRTQITEPIAGTIVSLKQNSEIKIKTNPAMANGIKMWAAGKTNPLGSKSLDFRYLR